MKNKLLLFIYSSCIFLIRIHSLQVSEMAKETRLRRVILKATNEGHRANHAENKAKNTSHDAPGIAKQQIPYNLDLVRHNGSSTLLYSQDKDVLNGGFTEWSTWSECPTDCGKRPLRSRERYCTNPIPANGGADCVGERFELNLCKLVPCHTTTVRPNPRHDPGSSHRSFDKENYDEISEDVRWRLGEWSGWSKCHCSKGYQKRYRECYSHGGLRCPGNTAETKPCQPNDCAETEKSSLVNVDPKDFCGFNPCDFSKCLLAPLGSCVSDYKCRPVFFDEKNKRVEKCLGKRVYVNPEKVLKLCKVNPCDYSRCLLDFTEERCVVGTRCQAVYYNSEGQPQKCTAILKVPARQVCGYDPCNGQSCLTSPNARCLVTSKCHPIYVNAFNERIRKCEEKAERTKDTISGGQEEEYEAEPDVDEDDDEHDDDDGYDDDDNGNGDEEKSFARYNNDDDGDDDEEENNNFRVRSDNKQYGNNDEDGYNNNDDDDDVDVDDDNNNEDDVDNEHKDEQDNFRIPTGLKTPGSASPQNVSKPILDFKSTNNENGQRRTEKISKKGFSKSINASTLNLEDIVKGKLQNSQGVVSGTVQKSMKIISNKKKPATFYYFEAKGGAANENRQFMIITAPKTKKSSVLAKSRHTSQTTFQDKS